METPKVRLAKLVGQSRHVKNFPISVGYKSSLCRANMWDDNNKERCQRNKQAPAHFIILYFSRLKRFSMNFTFPKINKNTLFQSFPYWVQNPAYLIDFGEEASPDQLCRKVFPEFQFTDSGAELLPSVHGVVLVWGLAVKRWTRGLRGNVHVTHSGDVRWETTHR